MACAVHPDQVTGAANLLDTNGKHLGIGRGNEPIKSAVYQEYRRCVGGHEVERTRLRDDRVTPRTRSKDGPQKDPAQPAQEPVNVGWPVHRRDGGYAMCGRRAFQRIGPGAHRVQQREVGAGARTEQPDPIRRDAEIIRPLAQVPQSIVEVLDRGRKPVPRCEPVLHRGHDVPPRDEGLDFRHRAAGRSHTHEPCPAVEMDDQRAEGCPGRTARQREHVQREGLIAAHGVDDVALGHDRFGHRIADDAKTVRDIAEQPPRGAGP